MGSVTYIFSSVHEACNALFIFAKFFGLEPILFIGLGSAVRKDNTIIVPEKFSSEFAGILNQEEIKYTVSGGKDAVF